MLRKHFCDFVVDRIKSDPAALIHHSILIQQTLVCRWYSHRAEADPSFSVSFFLCQKPESECRHIIKIHRSEAFRANAVSLQIKDLTAIQTDSAAKITHVKTLKTNSEISRYRMPAANLLRLDTGDQEFDLDWIDHQHPALTQERITCLNESICLKPASTRTTP